MQSNVHNKRMQKIMYLIFRCRKSNSRNFSNTQNNCKGYEMIVIRIIWKMFQNKSIFLPHCAYWWSPVLSVLYCAYGLSPFFCFFAVFFSLSLLTFLSIPKNQNIASTVCIFCWVINRDMYSRNIGFLVFMLFIHYVWVTFTEANATIKIYQHVK